MLKIKPALGVLGLCEKSFTINALQNYVFIKAIFLVASGKSYKKDTLSTLGLTGSV
ncbi:MAG: hypothetical protein HC896_18400 [Bacteroidales bacterium]|nr:hypothetical protein [Bacteroidales bacterium]